MAMLVRRRILGSIMYISNRMAREDGMKKLQVPLVIILVMLASCASYKPIKNPVLERIIPAEGQSADAIYEKTLQWMAQTFVSSKAVLEYQNKKTGQIIGNASVQVSYDFSSCLTSFVIDIQVKDNKVRVQIKNARTGPSPINNTRDWSYFCQTVEPMLLSYAEFLNKPNESNDW